MGKLTFNTVEEAVAHIEGQNTKIVELEKEVTLAKKAQADAEQIASDAVDKANKLEESQPKRLTVKVDGKNYEVKFGVDGATKEELAKDSAKLKKLIKGGSAAVKVLED